MAQLLLTDYETSLPVVVPYHDQTDIQLSPQSRGPTMVAVHVNGTRCQTLAVWETPDQIRRREAICQF